MWTQLFSIITVTVCLIIVIRKFPSTAIDIKYASITGLTAWLIGDIVISVNIPFKEVLHIVFQSLGLSLVLIVFLIFIRQRKPVIFRYPYSIVFTPLLIPASQFIVMETEIMRQIIFMSLHGTSIIIFTLLSAGYGKELNHKIATIVGVLLLLGGFAFFWILQNYYIVFDWAWGLTNMLGMIACTYSFSDLLNTYENN